jgi:hypothetical protein
MHVQPITTLTLFQFEGRSNKFWAFKQMGIAAPFFEKIPGLDFFKLLGTGGGNGFSLRPNFSQYGLLFVWKSEEEAKRFFQEDPLFLSYKKRAVSFQTYYLSPSMCHGKWDGKEPFTPAAKFDDDAPVAVITRARIRLKQLIRFWRFVPSASRDVHQQRGLQLAVGIGELPFIQQATFSLWEDGKSMLEYAYKRREHARVIQQTRKHNWYSEELFARFQVLRVESN